MLSMRMLFTKHRADNDKQGVGHRLTNKSECAIILGLTGRFNQQLDGVYLR